MSHADEPLSSFEFEVLTALHDIKDTDNIRNSVLGEHSRGWFTNVEIRGFLNSPSLATRTALRSLALHGFASETANSGYRQFRVTQKGHDRIQQGPPSAVDVIASYAWTGVVDAVQVERALSIVSELEDACESISNNSERAQVIGLVRALEILLTVPEPPRAGIAALVRDPAFGNFVQLAAFLAALLAAIKA